MTSPVEPGAAPSVPEFPALGDPAFNSKAYTWGSWMPTLVTWITTSLANAYQNALSAFESATASAASATSSDQSSAVAMASANFKGEWSGLTGALNKPASVAHQGRFWLLLANLPDVAAAVPGVSASWLAFDIILPIIPVTTATFTAVANKQYSIQYAGQVTGTMPPYVEGTMMWITIANGRRDTVLLRQNPADSFMGIVDDLTLVEPTTYALRGIASSWRGL